MVYTYFPQHHYLYSTLFPSPECPCLNNNLYGNLLMRQPPSWYVRNQTLYNPHPMISTLRIYVLGDSEVEEQLTKLPQFRHKIKYRQSQIAQVSDPENSTKSPNSAPVHSQTIFAGPSRSGVTVPGYSCFSFLPSLQPSVTSAYGMMDLFLYVS